MDTTADELRERLQKRRAALRQSAINDTTFDTEAETSYSSKHVKDETWDTTIETLEQENAQQIEEENSLVKDLHSKHKKTRKVLSKTLVTDEEADITSELEKVKDKLRHHKEESRVEEELATPRLLETTEHTLEIPVITPRKSLPSSRDEGSVTSASSIGRSPAAAGMSIRERMQARLKSKQEQAAAQTEPGRRLRRKDWAEISTRFDATEPGQSRDEEETQLLEKSQRLRERWKTSASASVAKAQVTTEEAYDFFTRVWEPEAVEMTTTAPQRKPSAASHPEPSTSDEAQAGKSGEEIQTEEEEKAKVEEEPQVEDTTDETKLLIEDFTDSEDWQPQRAAPAEYIPYRTRVDREQAFYFTPSTMTIPTRLKIPDESEVRNLEEEGLYVGERPPVNQINMNLMEDRLLHERNRGGKWFGDDGWLKALPDPLKPAPCRPPVPEDEEADLNLEYRKAMSREFDSRYIDGSADNRGRYQLNVNVSVLAFSHHPLFSREHVLATRLAQMHEDFCCRREKNAAVFLTDKLQALKTAADHLKGIVRRAEEQQGQADLEEPRQRLSDYTLDIRQTRVLRDAELAKDRQLLKSTIKTWKKIKSLREFQGYTNTSVRLLIHKQVSNKEEDERLWNQEIEDEVDETEEEHAVVYESQLKEHRKAVELWKAQKKAKVRMPFGHKSFMTDNKVI
ncbi:PREDICTED: coiled-coil and C2 domain-containing protein 2A-like [Priapulus caudatus]|uniref:Coiled-coil and C2 domain-containing protein 2A-like n=1 Tax=Priapulus caudatus TaxID=37621 RepID=A0ABM1E2Z3_PRICU|nr:PREDICTED: coiled-coil and C2 domain-containing protein 2A-like [Priapulus caudatus]